MSRPLVFAAVVVALAHGPAGALVGTAGTPPTAYGDASMCLPLHVRGRVAGLATAVGTVRTATAPPPILSGSFGARRMMAPNSVVADVKPLLTTYGFDQVCVGGAGLPVVAGTVTFTFTVQTETTSYAGLFVCSYSDAGPSCV